ncbi:hypothetical protein [Actinocatenispora rupis]|uniref:hypothetical protein n=1 Tax=Actinocatenispora rupis TaxID=519421 RepID=UPI0019412197|nr:hypothetical protein [Actinocatenispora rupis]
MVTALRLLTQVDGSCRVVVRQPTFDRRTKARQPAFFVIDDLRPYLDSPSGELDPRLVNAKKVTAVLMLNDGGIVEIDLTDRKWTCPAPSDGVRELLTELDRALRDGARARATFGPLRVLAFWWYPLLAFVLAEVDASTNPHLAHQFQERSAQLDYSPWLIHLAWGALPWWILSTAAALVLTIFRSRSGALRIWPASILSVSPAEIGYRIWSNAKLWDFVRMALIAILGAVAGTLLTRWK